jgi:hypothetical protein
MAVAGAGSGAGLSEAGACAGWVRCERCGASESGASGVRAVGEGTVCTFRAWWIYVRASYRLDSYMSCEGMRLLGGEQAGGWECSGVVARGCGVLSVDLYDYDLGILSLVQSRKRAERDSMIAS